MGDYDISPSVDAREEFSTLSRPRPGNSVFPLLDSKSLAHDVHLSVETVDAPAAAIAAAVAKVADEVEAALVVLGTNNALVRPWGVAAHRVRVRDEVEAVLIVLGTNDALVRPWGVTGRLNMSFPLLVCKGCGRGGPCNATPAAVTERCCALGRPTNWCMPSGAWQGVHERLDLRLAGRAQLAKFLPATVAVGQQNAFGLLLLHAAYPSLNH